MSSSPSGIHDQPLSEEAESKAPIPEVEEDGEKNGNDAHVMNEGRKKILRVDRIWDKKSRKYRYVKTAKPKSSKKFSQNVVTVARIISVQGVFSGEYLVEIHGAFLPAIFAEIYKNIEGLSFPTLITLHTLEIRLLFHAIGPLQEVLDLQKKLENPNPQTIFELESVLEFTSDHFFGEIKAMNNLPEKHIDYDTIWMLFPPGILVYSVNALQQPQVSRLRSIPYVVKKQDGSKAWVLHLESVDFDGVHLGTVRTIGIIEEFGDAVPISTLPFQPLKTRPDYHDLQATLIERGDRLLMLHGRHLQEYQGHALQEGKDEKLIKFNSHGRVMLDPVVLNRHHPNNTLLPDIKRPISRNQLTSELKMMFNPLLYGFSLGDKTWGAFAESSLRPVVWNDSIIQSLVVPEEHKEFIQVLVKQHGNEADRSSFDDIVKDKGKGLIGLLVGPPGVGKTLTAEAMAEVSHKALYIIGSGELGEGSSSVVAKPDEGPNSVMAKLAGVMELVEAWNAVLLLDEADVFLTERDNTNLTRNAITSVFLRNLEYFQGIMLLTTNRLASFDPAFQSRIHFCLEYPDLAPDARAGIWRIFLDKMTKSTDLNVQVGEVDIDTLSSLNLNGRQIKNAMSISQTFAQNRKEDITLGTIQKAINFSQSGWTIGKG
ncbi:ATP-dependent zinc metalloprotease FtsH 2 [Apiospora arundinis]|uniref:ATP-dependent zinc metalloprotease FtsH 2 n=1 Tax=Apiospora arundinis TaxID=335852 RepID=A0ABR2HTI7_9PEZI